jgi:hypothetical protein
MNKLLQLSEDRLFLKPFRDLEEQILRLLPERVWIRVLLRGLLKALEQRLIAARASATVTEAIDEYKASQPPPTDPTVYDLENLHIYHPAFRDHEDLQP